MQIRLSQESKKWQTDCNDLLGNITCLKGQQHILCPLVYVYIYIYAYEYILIYIYIQYLKNLKVRGCSRNNEHVLGPHLSHRLLRAHAFKMILLTLFNKKTHSSKVRLVPSVSLVSPPGAFDILRTNEASHSAIWRR